MTGNMTKEQMEAFAKEHFGEEARVYYSNNQWNIETGVEEHFDPEEHKDRPAYAYYTSWDGGENALDRWARKNGHGGESMAELFDSYDEEEDRRGRKIVAQVRKNIANGMSFEGLEDFRDRVLAYAEERGI